MDRHGPGRRRASERSRIRRRRLPHPVLEHAVRHQRYGEQADQQIELDGDTRRTGRDGAQSECKCGSESLKRTAVLEGHVVF